MTFDRSEGGLFPPVPPVAPPLASSTSSIEIKEFILNVLKRVHLKRQMHFFVFQ